MQDSEDRAFAVNAAEATDARPDSGQTLADADQTLAGAGQTMPDAGQTLSDAGHTSAHAEQMHPDVDQDQSTSEMLQQEQHQAESVQQTLPEQTGSSAVHENVQLQEVPPSSEEDLSQHMLLKTAGGVQTGSAVHQPLQLEVGGRDAAMEADSTTNADNVDA